MWILVATIGGLLIGTIIGFAIRKYIAESKIGSAEKEAERIINDAEKEAESIEREAMVEAKEKAHKIKDEVEEECRERRTELQRFENRLIKKEDHLLHLHC